VVSKLPPRRMELSGGSVMTRQLTPLILCSGLAMLTACATKSFVQEQVSATETKLTQQVDAQETKLRETADRAAASRQAIDAAGRRLEGLNSRVDEAYARVDELGALAGDAKRQANAAEEVGRDRAARLSQRIADRNKYRLLETTPIYFDSDRADIRYESISKLDTVAKSVEADSNAVLELQGFADPRGSDRYNYQLARERVEAVIRYLVQHHGIELRQIRAVAMGKVALGAGEKATEAFAQTRRVDMRLFAPWSSREDAQTQLDRPAPAPTATVAEPASFAQLTQARAAPVVTPAQPRPTEPTRTAGVVPPVQEAAPPTSLLLNHPVPPQATDVPPRELTRSLPEFLKTVTPKDLGGTE
jgi:outer membrane protein OmpA-like peptidoglycan-associated protein